VRRGLVGVLISTLTLSLGGPADARVRSQLEQQVVVYILDGMSYEEAIADPQIRRLASTGGIGLMTVGDDDEARDAATGLEALGSGGADPGALGEALRQARVETVADDLGARMVEGAQVVRFEPGGGPVEAPVVIRRRWTGSPLESVAAVDVMFVLVVPAPSPAMTRAGDEAAPIILSYGHPDFTCLPVAACISAPTSDTTRRSGIVSNVDVAPTILEFLRLPIPPEMSGSPIRFRFVEGPPPSELHQRYLRYQRIHTPVGLMALAVVLFTLFASVGLLLIWRTAPATVARTLAILALISVALPVVMLHASLLPRLRYEVVLPTLSVGAALVAMIALALGRDRPTMPVAVVAGLGMGVVILDGILGWPAMMMSLLGDSALEGVRFYGMGNAYAGVYMAGAILLASRIPPIAGMALLAAAGLLAGLPGFGAELGTSFTLFAAAGLWYIVRVQQRFGRREAAIAVAVALVGLAAILLVHRFSPDPTHVTKVVDDSPGDIIATFGRRLALNVRNTSATPVAWLIVALLPVWLIVAWKRLGPVGRALREHPSWRDAAIVLALASIIGFIVNDTIGVAGMGVTYLSAALIYPALRERWTSG
jgi:hypothetical protein